LTIVDMSPTYQNIEVGRTEFLVAAIHVMTTGS